MDYVKLMAVAFLALFSMVLFFSGPVKPPFDLTWTQAIVLLLGAPTLVCLIGVIVSYLSFIAIESPESSAEKIFLWRLRSSRDPNRQRDEH